MVEEKVSELLAVTDDLVNYIGRYGGACRDCADNSGVCPMSGLPCADAGDAICHVLSAINYGVAHGYLPDPRTPTPVTEDVGALRTALENAKTWHESEDKALSKQPPSHGPNGNQWARLQHREQIDEINAALSASPSPVTEDARHLTADEQAIMHQSLRDSVAVVASPSPPKADGPGEVSVKALEWVQSGFGGMAWRAHSLLGIHRVQMGSTAGWSFEGYDGSEMAQRAATIDEAKADAQADYEARILSALVSPSIKREA